jgi:hypothetical protein
MTFPTMPMMLYRFRESTIVFARRRVDDISDTIV